MKKLPYRISIQMRKEKSKTSISSEAPPSSSEHSELAELFLEGFSVSGDSGSDPKVKPTWVNDDLLKKGQRIGREYIVGQFISNIIALQFLLSYPHASDPLVATGNSDTVKTARRRYISTCLRIMQWYTADLWGESTASKQVSIVRAMHARVRTSLETASRDKLAEALQLDPTEAEVEQPLWCHLQEMFAKEKEDIILPPDYASYDKLYLSQSEMVATQFCFFGFMLQAPDKFGMYTLSDDDLEALVHVWACIGYQLGIEDRFNKCIQGLESARKTWNFYLKHVYIPSLGFADPRWEHMNRCIVTGVGKAVRINPSLELSVVIIAELTGQNHAIEKARSLLSWKDRVFECMYYVLFDVLMGFAVFRSLSSKYLFWIFNKRATYSEISQITKARKL